MFFFVQCNLPQGPRSPKFDQLVNMNGRWVWKDLISNTLNSGNGIKTSLLFWGFSHQSKENVFRGEAKKLRSCFMFCRLTPRLKGRARNFHQSKSLYRGRELRIFTSPRAFIKGESYIRRRSSRFQLDFPSPRGAGQSLHRGEARNFFKS